MKEFAVEVWNREREEWECFTGGIHCAVEANDLAREIMNRGYFARVVTVD